MPLESRVDFLTLQPGQKFELPFMVLVVFATNIRPAELVDEAFLRRIHYKVFAESPTVDEFIADLRELLPRPRTCRSTARWSSTCSQNYYKPRKIAAARLPAARSDRAGAVARRLSRRAAAS